mgnify:FL=1
MTISRAYTGYRTGVAAVRGECVNTAPARQPDDCTMIVPQHHVSYDVHTNTVGKRSVKNVKVCATVFKIARQPEIDVRNYRKVPSRKCYPAAAAGTQSDDS